MYFPPFEIFHYFARTQKKPMQEEEVRFFKISPPEFKDLIMDIRTDPATNTFSTLDVQSSATPKMSSCCSESGDFLMMHSCILLFSLLQFFSVLFTVQKVI